MKVGSSDFFAKNLKRPYLAKDTLNYGKARHKGLTYAHAQDFVIKELNFVKISEEND